MQRKQSMQCESYTVTKPMIVSLLHKSGIPIGQQVLCFAGKDLKDHLSLADHELQQYTLSDEVGCNMDLLKHGMLVLEVNVYPSSLRGHWCFDRSCCT